MGRRPYKLVMRFGPRVVKERFDSLDAALDAMSARIPHVSRRDTVGAVIRDYEPTQQVAGRLELHGPHARGGVDVRGDGSAEAYRGWIRKRLIEQREGEGAVDALRRELVGA